MSAVTHPRARARRGAVRASTWWGRAWVRAVEEAAFAEQELRTGRSLARSGAVGQITVDAGSVVAAVRDRADGWADTGVDAWTVQLDCHPLGDDDLAMVTELVAAESGRVAALLAGDLPHPLVEATEEAGVELLPYSGDLGWTCSCAAWADPCPHGLAVGYQVGWLLDADPFVLLQLRGLTRERLLADLHARTHRSAAPGPTGPGSGGPVAAGDPDLEVALDAVLRARRALALLAEGRPADHLF